MRGDWRRQRGEPNRAHSLFEQYLELGPGRSLRALARRSGASYSYLKKLSHLWRWQERAAGWQVNVQQASRVDDVDLVAEARKRQIRDAHTLLQLSRAQLARWIIRDEEGTMRLLRRLTPHQAARFWQAGYRVERGLLPPLTPEEPVDVEKSLREARYERKREEETGEAHSRQKPDLLEALSQLILLLRKEGLSPIQVREHHARLLRWLWLPEEESLSLEAIAKANRSRGLRARHHGTRQTTRKTTGRAARA
jgi:hypothetical protein